MRDENKQNYKVPYNYLDRQFCESEQIWSDLRELVRTGEFTIGPPVVKFEEQLARFVGTKFALGTNTGTDALILALKGLGVGPGDEVITQPNSFFATVGAIVAVGARPVFVDVRDDYAIDETLIEGAVTSKTKAILPVHWAGQPASMLDIMEIAKRRNLVVVEDACPSLGASINGKFMGSFGDAGAFSWHPLKPLNVWGDGGAIVTNNEKLIAWLKLYRNHGMINRDQIELWGINNRLQSLQAVVALRQLPEVPKAVARRNEIAARIDAGLRDVPEIKIPTRDKKSVHSYQIYILRAQKRDALIAHLQNLGVDPKIHYPIPLHLQKPAKVWGYKPGDFPKCEAQARELITLPAHQFLTNDEVDYMIRCTREFYDR